MLKIKHLVMGAAAAAMGVLLAAGAGEVMAQATGGPAKAEVKKSEPAKKAEAAKPACAEDQRYDAKKKSCVARCGEGTKWGEVKSVDKKTKKETVTKKCVSICAAGEVYSAKEKKCNPKPDPKAKKAAPAPAGGAPAGAPGAPAKK